VKRTAIRRLEDEELYEVIKESIDESGLQGTVDEVERSTKEEVALQELEYEAAMHANRVQVYYAHLT
jgi:hypothetical protein